MTRLNIDYESFEDYARRALKSATRAKLKRKFKAAEKDAPIVMEMVTDVSAVIDEIYPLYLQVYHRSKLRFDKLTKGYFVGLGLKMPDKARFFLWRQNERIVAFTLCMIEEDTLYAEYIGLEYAVDLDLHLYHYAVRDMINWGIANGFKFFGAGALNYDPKLQMRHRLEPIDLYCPEAGSAAARSDKAVSDPAQIPELRRTLGGLNVRRKGRRVHGVKVREQGPRLHLSSSLGQSMRTRCSDDIRAAFRPPRDASWLGRSWPSHAGGASGAGAAWKQARLHHPHCAACARNRAGQGNQDHGV
jgi:hypothetical protein